MKKYLFEYILHPGEDGKTDKLYTPEDLIELYGLQDAREQGRTHVFGEDEVHSKGMIHLYPMDRGSYLTTRFALERELTKSRVMARLLRAGKIKLLEDDPKPEPRCEHRNVVRRSDLYFLCEDCKTPVTLKEIQEARQTK